MTPNDTGSDPELQRQLLALRREDPTSPTFTDRVLLDLERRGLVRSTVAHSTARWWAVAAAVVIFAAGIGVGAALADPRESSGVSTPSTSTTADRAGVERNVPRVGQTEVWF